MPSHDLPLARYVAGELDEEQTRNVDQHLLGCEQCWAAIRADRAGRAAARMLRHPNDPGLADRVSARIELTRCRPARRRPALALLLAAVVVLVTLSAVALLFPSSSSRPRDTGVLRTVVALGTQLPTAPAAGRSDVPVPLGPQHTLHQDGQTIIVQSYRYGPVTAVVARTQRPIAMPPDASVTGGGPMPWTVRRGAVTVYCPRGKVLLASRGPAPVLVDLAAALRLH